MPAGKLPRTAPPTKHPKWRDRGGCSEIGFWRGRAGGTGSVGRPWGPGFPPSLPGAHQQGDPVGLFLVVITRTWWDPQAANTTEGSTYPPHASLSLVCFWVPIRPWAPKAGRVGTTGRPPTRLHMSSHKKSDPPQMTPPCAARRRGISRRQKFQSGGVGSQMSLWVVRPVEAGAQVKTAHARGRAGGVPGENKFREAAQIRFFAYGLQKRICP